MLSFIAPLIISIFGTSMLSSIFKKKFEVVLPVFFMLSALCVYIFSIFNLFIVGVWLIIIFSCLFPLFLIYWKFKKKNNIKDIFKYILTPGFVMYILIYIFIFLLNYNRKFIYWDEFSHWGMMVKETIRLKGFYASKSSILVVHLDYPPIITLHESIWSIISGVYRESLIYTSLQILGISLLFPFLSKFEFEKNKKFIVKFLLLFIMIITIPILIICGKIYFYSSIYIDTILGALIGYGLTLVLVTKKYDKFFIFNLSVLFSFLILTKQIAIVFVMLIIGNLILNLILNKKISKENIKSNYKKIILSLFALIIIPIILTTIWNGKLKANEIVGQFNVSNIKLSELFGIYRGTAGKLYQHQAINNFINEVFYNHKFLNTRLIDFTYFQLVLITCLLMYFVMKLSKNKDDKNKFTASIISIIIGAIGYAFTLMILYVFCFDAYEAPRLASLDRYINTYWFAIFILIGAVYMYFISSNKKTKIIKYSLPIILVYTLWFDFNIVKTFKPVLKKPSESVVSADVNLIKSHIKKDDKVFVVAQKTNGSITFIMQYEMHPNMINTNYYSLGKKYNDGDAWTKNISAKKWLKMLKDYDYVYLYNVDDNFTNKYGLYFDCSQDEIKSKQLYKINKANNKLKLVK